jgi:hypothetical protein
MAFLPLKVSVSSGGAIVQGTTAPIKALNYRSRLILVNSP